LDKKDPESKPGKDEEPQNSGECMGCEFHIFPTRFTVEAIYRVYDCSLA
jgi:hypothetical protein